MLLNEKLLIQRKINDTIKDRYHARVWHLPLQLYREREVVLIQQQQSCVTFRKKKE